MPSPLISAIQVDGKLLWYWHDAQVDGTFKWQGRKTVGSGWNSFSTVFCGGAGVI